ncbi:SRPBCC domain-containing protein [Ciceribacter sp. L1K22]|uniref:SRPBCC family protein n=1 Tax=Ciceribacter sp. L1K22 TaxID=2820275 RepID=UPI001ABE73CB|nr:SRPBCC domain-containing protein [Ciceribacter sp. L1K22]MBO3761146.1 SRPBCC domain-containing protein [Ciceribacter sp. L1K22]
MTAAAEKTLSVVVEREFPHPPEKIWRALTQPHLIEEWLMKNAFSPTIGHGFTLSADWGTVTCEVKAVEEHRRLCYTWDAAPLESLVTWTLTPTESGTLLRMEQTGFRHDQPMFYGGAKQGWPRFLDRLEGVLARIS